LPWRPCRFLEAIELYRKANHHMEAAKLLVDLAKQSAEKKVTPVWLPMT
jgi:WD repeat-containing protein 35